MLRGSVAVGLLPVPAAPAVLAAPARSTATCDVTISGAQGNVSAAGHRGQGG